MPTSKPPFKQMYIIYNISGEVKAVKDVWLIGDQFLMETYHELSTMKSAAVTDRKKPPFIFQFYNVYTFTMNPLSLQHDVLARIVNCLIKGLNDNVKLPSLLIMIPDHDLLNFLWEKTDGDRDISILLNRAIGWIATQIDRALEI